MPILKHPFLFAVVLFGGYSRFTPGSVFKDHSWSLWIYILYGLGKPYGVSGTEPGWAHVRQAPYLLHYCSSPRIPLSSAHLPIVISLKTADSKLTPHCGINTNQDCTVPRIQWPTIPVTQSHPLTTVCFFWPYTLLFFLSGVIRDVLVVAGLKRAHEGLWNYIWAYSMYIP